MPIKWLSKHFTRSAKDRSTPGTGLLPATGRSSVDADDLHSSLVNLQNYYGFINPKIPVNVLRYLSFMAIVNPDISQTVSNFVFLGNTGHKLNILGKNADKAIERLNEKAAIWYKHNAGIDSLINQYLYQIIISGANSSEDVPTPAFDGVEKIVMVPVDQIRFRYEDGNYKPLQVLPNRTEPIYLNEFTYHYFALQTVDNSPYAIPPLTSALRPVTMQDKALKNLEYALDKIGLTGFKHVKIKPLPPEKGETPWDRKHRARNEQYRKLIADELKVNFSAGLLVTFDDQTVESSPISDNTGGIRDIFQLIEEQVFSGAKTQSGLHGRAYTSTETFATVTYNLLISILDNMRRLVKRRHEATDRLDLQLAGLEVDHLSIQFNRNKRLNPNVEAQANSYDTNVVLKKVKAGMISPDQAAQELGYPEWFDEELLKAMPEDTAVKNFRWNSNGQRYELERPQISITNTGAYSKDRVKNEGDDNDNSDNGDNGNNSDKGKSKIPDDLKEKLRENIRNYLRDMLPYFDKLKDDVLKHCTDWISIGDNYAKVSEEPIVFLQEALSYIESHPDYKGISNDSWFKETSTTLITDVLKYHKKYDATVFGGEFPAGVQFELGKGDLEARDFYQKLDTFYFSKFISNDDFGSRINKFILDFIERGESEFSMTDAAKKEFLRLFGRALNGDFEYQIERIVETSINRLRNYSHMSQLHEAGFSYGVVRTSDPCKICQKMDGNRIPIADAWNIVQKFVSITDMDEAHSWLENSNVSLEDADKPVENLILEGKGIPPFHIKCKCFVEGVYDG